jgi:hypothetical protein
LAARWGAPQLILLPAIKLRASTLLISPLLFFSVSTIAALLLSLACTTSNAERRGGGSAYDGTWSVTIYTLRGNCGSVRAAVRIVGGRVYSEDQSRVVRDKAPRTRSAVSEGKAG